MTKAQRKRRSEIIKELSEMSRNGWTGFTTADWQPLEIELAQITNRLTRQ